MTWQTFGHQAVKNIFSTQLDAGQFNHAYLLIGPVGVGKFLLAQEFAAKITNASSGSQNLDVVVLDHLIEGGVVGVREALATISTTPLSAKYKVVIIPYVDRFNVASTNALLKILEEPAPHTIFVLTADSADVLLTVKSRCQSFNLYPLADSELTEFAKSQNLVIDDSMLMFAHGSTKLLGEFAADPKSFHKLQEQILSLEQAARGTNFEKMVAVQTFAELEAEDLQQLLSHWMWKLKRNLSNNPHTHKTISVILEALQKLSQSMNKKLIVQSVLLNA